MSNKNQPVDLSEYALLAGLVAVGLGIFGPYLQAFWLSDHLTWFREHLYLFFIAPIFVSVALSILYWGLLAKRAIMRRLKSSAPVSCI